MKNAILVTVLGVMGLLTQGCTNNLTLPTKDIAVIVSYAYYPLPTEYGDTIQIYQKNLDGSEEYETTLINDGSYNSCIDTVMVSKGSTLKAYYTYKKYIGTMEVKDTVRSYGSYNIKTITVPRYTKLYVKETITVEEPYRWLIKNTIPN